MELQYIMITLLSVVIVCLIALLLWMKNRSASKAATTTVVDPQPLHPLKSAANTHKVLHLLPKTQYDCSGMSSYVSNENGDVLFCPFRSVPAPEHFDEFMSYKYNSCGSNDVPCTKCFYDNNMVEIGIEESKKKAGRFNLLAKNIGLLSRYGPDLVPVEHHDSPGSHPSGVLIPGIVRSDAICHPL